MGKPTVATQVGGISDCILHNETGFLIEPQDEEGLARVVLHLLQHSQTRTKMGENASTWSSANFSIDIIAQRYFDFYRQVSAHGRKATI